MSSSTSPGSDVATIAATRAFYERLAAACDADVGQIELALANLAAMELDQDTLDGFQSTQEDAQRAAGRCRSALATLNALHHQMEEAVNATPDAARTEFYQEDATGPYRQSQPHHDAHPKESEMRVPEQSDLERVAHDGRPPLDADQPNRQPDHSRPGQHYRCGDCGYVVGPQAQQPGGCPNCQTRGRAFSPTEIAFPAPPSDDAIARDTRPAETAIRQAYAGLAHRPGDIVPLAEIRAALPADLDRETVDAALTKLVSHSDVNISPRTDQKQADDRTQQAALAIGGSYSHTMSLDAEGPNLLDTLQRIRSTSRVQAASMLAPLNDALVANVAARMNVDTSGTPAEVRQRVAERAEANQQASLTDARQGETDGKLLYRADNDPEWVRGWTDADRQAAREAAARLLARADREPSWAYIRERATRWL